MTILLLNNKMSEFWKVVSAVLLSSCVLPVLAADDFGAIGELEHNVPNIFKDNAALNKDNQQLMYVLLGKIVTPATFCMHLQWKKP